jgi:hypothetical protein
VRSQKVVWVVDWDIPLDKNRFGFYRALRRLRKEMHLEGGMSSMSVLITEDEKLAWAVYGVAAEYAVRFHIYEANEHTCATKE